MHPGVHAAVGALLAAPPSAWRVIDLPGVGAWRQPTSWPSRTNRVRLFLDALVLKLFLCVVTHAKALSRQLLSVFVSGGSRTCRPRLLFELGPTVSVEASARGTVSASGAAGAVSSQPNMPDMVTMDYDHMGARCTGGTVGAGGQLNTRASHACNASDERVPHRPATDVPLPFPVCRPHAPATCTLDGCGHWRAVHRAVS